MRRDDLLAVAAARRHVRSSPASARHSATVSGATIACARAEERVGEHGRVAGLPGELDRLAAECVTTLPQGLVAQGSRQPRKQPRAQFRILARKAGQALLEQRHEPFVVARARPHDSPAVARSRHGQLTRKPEAPGEAGGHDEGRPRRRSLSGSDLCLAERKEQLAASGSLAGPRSRGRRGRSGRGAPPPRRRERERPVTGKPGVADAPLEVAGCDRMVSELREMRPGLVPAEGFQRLADPSVEGDAASAVRPSYNVSRISTCVKRRRSAEPGHICDDASRHRLVERLEEEPLVRNAGCASKRAEREFASEHRRAYEQLVALRREMSEPPRDHVADARRDRAPGRAGLGPDALEREQAHGFAHEERVSLRLVVKRRDQLG